MASVAVSRKRATSKPYNPSPSHLRLKRARISTDSIAGISTQANDHVDLQHNDDFLPFQISDNIPLPMLSGRQSGDLSVDDYQSIESSKVLKASIDRSRHQWINAGIFSRYWIKPETGKHAKAAPANNPDPKTMKAKGPCRIRIEPHIFEAELFVDEKFKPKTQPVAPSVPRTYLPQPVLNAHTQPYRFQQAQRIPPQQQNLMPPSHIPVQNSARTASNSQPATNTIKDPDPITPIQPGTRGRTLVPPIPHNAPKPRQSPDPVISMLAERASINQDLKMLMKEVATGKASQEQLRIFQRHIDELTRIIQDREMRKKEQENADNGQTNGVAFIPQLDGASDVNTTGSVTFQSPGLHHSSNSQYHFQQPWVPDSVALPVVLQFTTPGSSDDRFLFPQHSVLESLSKQHTLVSFIITRPENLSGASSDGQPARQMWQPVTIMVEVAYGREELLNHIKRWVKPLNEVREHMQKIIAEGVRAPDEHLAFRLPFLGKMIESQKPAYTLDPSHETQGVPKDRPDKQRPSSRNADQGDKENDSVIALQDNLGKLDHNSNHGSRREKSVEPQSVVSLRSGRKSKRT